MLDAVSIELMAVARRVPARTLLTATFDPNLYLAVDAFRQSFDREILIGTLALNFYAKPRFTASADFFLPKASAGVPDGFRRLPDGAIEHAETGGQLRLLTPAALGMPDAIAEKVVATSIRYDGLQVASAEGLVALKLHSARALKRHYKDRADMVSILSCHAVDMSGWGLGPAELALFEECETNARGATQQNVRM